LHVSLGRLDRRAGNHDQAQEHFGVATAMFREMQMPFRLEQAEAEAQQTT
jgi:hypothetical protein